VGAHTTPFTIEFYEDEAGRKPALEWLQALDAHPRRVIGTAMREILQQQGVQVCATSFGKQLGKGLFEFRVREQELLFRVFCHAHGDRLILRLGGYDKEKDPSPGRQAAEIEAARQRLTAWTARQQADRKRRGR
jgi:phage-related protein